MAEAGAIARRSLLTGLLAMGAQQARAGTSVPYGGEVAFRLVNDIDEAVDAALAVAAGAGPGGTPASLEVLANYTAFQQYRVALGRVQ